MSAKLKTKTSDSSLKTLKIKFSAFDDRVLDNCVNKIINIVTSGGASHRGAIPLPTIRQRISLNRSPHIDTKSKEIFYISHHKRLLYVMLTGGSQVMHDLKSIEIPSGVHVAIESIN